MNTLLPLTEGVWSHVGQCNNTENFQDEYTATLNRGAVCVGGGGSEGGERRGYIGQCDDTDDLPDEGRSLSLCTQSVKPYRHVM